MKDLNPFIKELLFSNDCVILPDFGGFIGNYTPARIDRESHTFYPPVKSISFNSKLSHNDGLLIGKISQKKDIGYPDARRLVEDYIIGLRSRLEKGERVHLDDIGHFHLNGEGGIQFEPENNVNFFLVLIKYTPVKSITAAIKDCAVIVSFKKYQPNIMAMIGLT